MIDADSPEDLHAPHVQALADRGQWAGLVGYWIAHRHAPVSVWQSHWSAIAPDRDSLPGRPWVTSSRTSGAIPSISIRPPPLLNTDDLGPEGTVAVVLALYFPRVALCRETSKTRLCGRESRSPISSRKSSWRFLTRPLRVPTFLTG